MSYAEATAARWSIFSGGGSFQTVVSQTSAIVARPESAISLEAVQKRYSSPSGETMALTNVDLTVAPGECFGIIGRSGAGKSTLLRLINGLEPPSEGRILVDGRNVAELDPDGLVRLRRNIGMVFQHFNLLSAKTVRDNVALPLLVAGVPRAERERRVDEVLTIVGLETKRDVRPSRLSGGQKQRVGIARALISGPKILLCDEATSALDPETTVAILGLLKDIHRRLGITIVLITHQMSVIRAICDRVLVLERGEAVETGPVRNVFVDPRHPATLALLGHKRRDSQDEVMIELRFDGQAVPDLARLAAYFDGPLRLLNASLDHTAGRSKGRMLVATYIPAAGVPDLAGLVHRMEVVGRVTDHG